MANIRRAVYAGSFDPVTTGHMYLIHEGARLFDELVVAIGTNPDKHYSFGVAQRLKFLEACTKGIRNVKLDQFSNMFLVDYARKIGAGYILRGIRNPHDYEYERSMRFVNADMDAHIVTVFLIPPREICEISSSFVKSLVGPSDWERVVREYLPPPVYRHFLAHFRHGNGRAAQPAADAEE